MSACVLSLTLAAIAEHPRTLLDYMSQFEGGMHMGVRMHPLDEAEARRWAHMLNASDAQLGFMLIQHERFVERHNEFMDREAPKFLAMGVELGEVWRSEGPNSPAIVPILKRGGQIYNRFRRALAAVEHSFIDSIEPVMSDEQVERLRVLRDEATRRSWRTSPSHARWVGIELRPIWENAAALASPDARSRVEHILLDYDSTYSQLVETRGRLAFDMSVKLVENRIARNERRITPAEAGARYRQIMDRKVEIARRKRLLQEQTVERIVEMISPHAAVAFTQAVKQAVFPEIYPDRTDLHAVFAALAEDEGLGDETSGVIAQMFETYKAQHKSICDTLESMCIEWGDQTEAGVSGFEPQFLPEALKPLRERRDDLAREWLTRLEEAVGYEPMARHAAFIPEAMQAAGASAPSSAEPRR